MAKTKKDRRIEIMQEKLHAYLDPELARARQRWDARDDTPEFDESVAKGIIKDKVAFYISEHFGVNFQMVRNYFAPNQLGLKAVDRFLEAGVSYDDVCGFHRTNRGLFKQRCNELAEPVSQRRVTVRHRGSNKFLRLTKDDGPVWTDMIHASGFDVFHTKELTLEFILHKYLSGDGLELDDLDANTIMRGAERWYHVPAL